MYFDIQCSTNVELSVLQQNQLTLSVEGWKLVDIKLKRWMACEPTVNASWQLILVDIKLKRWMACEPTANTSWQLIVLVPIICGSHSCRCVNCHHMCTHGDNFVFSVVLLFIYIYIVYSYIKLWQNSPIPSLHIC
jgi:hypothetical protein